MGKMKSKAMDSLDPIDLITMDSYTDGYNSGYEQALNDCIEAISKDGGNPIPLVNILFQLRGEQDG